ncbi:MAG: ParB/RepB/Spo0J family partition protein [Deltaproteobacteria bacterium]|nr:ParB/RepB/Spo0J family partition protein [Deltaproteobacteria bacterium]
MKPARKPLGRGLGSLIPGAGRGEGGSDAPGVQEVMLSLIDPNPRQMRVHFPEDALKSLASSIRLKGVLEPVLVRPLAGGRYELVAGERRTRASRMAGLDRIPAVVKELNDRESLEIALLENLMREDLNPVEEARGYQRLIDEFRYTHEQIASRTGLDRATVTNALRLLRLPEKVLAAVDSGDLSAGHAKVLLGLEHADQVIAAAATVTGKGLSVRETEELVRRMKSAPVAKAGRKAVRADPNVRQLQEELGRSLGARVEVKARKGGRGTLVIHYTSLDMLDTVIARLKRR